MTSVIQPADKHEDLKAAARAGMVVQWRKANVRGDPDWEGYPYDEGTGEVALDVLENNPDDYEFRLKSDAPPFVRSKEK